MNEQAATAGRKTLHLATGLLPAAWGVGVLGTVGAQVLLAAAAATAVAVELARRYSPAASALFVRLFGPMLKPHETRAITGATWLALAMLLAALVFPPAVARTALWAGAVGDGSAALVGGAWGAWRGQHGKSIAGSLACVLATAGGALWLGGVVPFAALGLGFVAALAEWPARPADDNVRVTLLVGVAAWVLVRG